MINEKNTAVKGKAFVLTNGMLHKVDAKTSHGLIRGSSRFKIEAVIDTVSFGKDAGEVLDGIHRDIPIYSNLKKAIQDVGKPDYCIIGLATVGGILPQSIEETLKEAILNRISIINGLHDLLSNRDDLVKLAKENDVQLIDIRKPKPFNKLPFWTPEVYNVTCPIIAVLGTDCAVGKRTTAKYIIHACEESGLKAEMIYTGQTGWMQGFKYGFIFDATLNDFVSGELSNAIITAYKYEKPDFIFLEGQSSLRNPSGPGGAEFLLSGNAKHVILVHEIKREYYDENPAWGKLNSVESEIQLIESYGANVIALMLNTRDCSGLEIEQARKTYKNALRIPVISPLEEGVNAIIPELLNIKKQ